jgi:hypothetical protein
VLVAGFQGVSQSSLDVTTLGRGGSDTTAVALAARSGADVCEIYTDVAGVFSADPRIVPDARKLPVLTFEEMLEMSASGAGVLQLRSVEYARNHGVTIHCRSSFEDGPGTVIQDEDETMERPLVTAVTHSTAEARITLTGLPDGPASPAACSPRWPTANVNVDMIIQNEPAARATGGHVVHRAARRLAARARRSSRSRRSSASARSRPTTDGEGVGRRSGNEEPSRRRRQDLHRARRRRREHRDDLHLADQDLVRRARGARGDRGARAAHARSSSAPTRCCPRTCAATTAQGELVRVAVVGATGAVGSTMLGVMRERSFPADEVVPFASERSAGPTIDWGDAT